MSRHHALPAVSRCKNLNVELLRTGKDFGETADPFSMGPTLNEWIKSVKIAAGEHLLPLMEKFSGALQEFADNIRPEKGKSGVFGKTRNERNLQDRLLDSQDSTFSPAKLRRETMDQIQTWKGMSDEDTKRHALILRNALVDRSIDATKAVKAEQEKIGPGGWSHRLDVLKIIAEQRAREIAHIDSVLTGQDEKKDIKRAFIGPQSQITTPSDYGEMIQKAALNQGGDLQTDNLRQQLENATKTGGLLQEIRDAIIGGVNINNPYR